MKLKTVFAFEDFRDYLRCYIETQPKKGWGTISRVAKHLRVQPSLVSQIISGLKPISVEQAIALSAFLGLNELETDYFVLLVEFDRAGSQQAKLYFRKKLESEKRRSLDLSRRVQKQTILSQADQAVFYSSWLYPAIRLYCSLGSGLTLDEVADRFALSRERASRILEFLCNTGLCVKRGHVYAMGPQITHLDRESPFISRHYVNWRSKSLQKSDSLNEDELMYSAPFSISRKDFELLRERLVLFIQEFLKTVQESDPEEIACLNLDLFWLNR